MHVLGTPPAFILSQDQTLRILTSFIFFRCFSLGFTKKLTRFLSSSYHSSVVKVPFLLFPRGQIHNPHCLFRKNRRCLSGIPVHIGRLCDNPTGHTSRRFSCNRSVFSTRSPAHFEDLYFTRCLFSCQENGWGNSLLFLHQNRSFFSNHLSTFSQRNYFILIYLPPHRRRDQPCF